jgi:hypothetical protein
MVDTSGFFNPLAAVFAGAFAAGLLEEVLK